MTYAKENVWSIVCAALALLFVLEIVLFCKVNALQNVAPQVQVQRVVEQQQPAQKEEHVYVYSVDRLVQNYPAVMELRKNFDSKISQLNEKVNEARKKLDDMKDKKAKEEYATVYLSSLTLQRDQLVEQYQKDLSALSQKINQALVDVANEHGLPYVLDAKAVVVTTRMVVDVTDAVLKKLK